MTPTFTRDELDYLHTQRLGRLATVDRAGAPQNNPVGFVIDETGAVLIGGRSLASTRKFKNAQRNAHVAFVVDNLASVDPWVVRGVEVRGTAETLTDTDPPIRGMSREVLRITAAWIASWGLDADRPGLAART